MKYFVSLLFCFVGAVFSDNSYNQSKENYTFVPELNLDQYDGKWFEVYKDLFDETFQKGGSCVTAEYTILDNGNVSVFNSEILPSGEISTIEGYAFYEDNNTGGELSVILDGAPMAPYWIIDLGPIYENQYDYSIVSDDKQISLFVLARDVYRFFDLYSEDVLITLLEFGFTKLNKPLIVNQTFCT